MFSPSAWLLLAILLVLLAVFHFIISFTRRNSPEGNNFINNYVTSVAFAYKCLLQLDLKTKGSHAYNILFITAAAYAITCMAYYEGMLTSFLTAKQPAPLLKSYFDAVDLGYRIIMEDGSRQATGFINAPVGSGRHAAYEKLIKNNPNAFLKPGEDPAPIILKDPLTATEVSEFAFRGDDRFLALVGMDGVSFDPVAFALQKDSEFLDLFNYHIIKMYQTGVLKFLQHKWG